MNSRIVGKTSHTLRGQLAQGVFWNDMCFVTEQMTASQAPPSVPFSMGLEHELKTKLEATHKALR